MRGLFTIINKYNGAFLTWDSFQFVTEEQIRQYKQNPNNPSQEQAPLYGLLFNKDWMAEQYIFQELLEMAKDAVVYEIKTQEAWDNMRKALLKGGKRKVVLNRCLLDYTHNCALLLYDLNEEKSFAHLQRLITADYHPGGYNLPDN